MPNAIIIGASSGMGRELAVQLHHNGYTVGIAARRETMLRDLQSELAGNTSYRVIDLSSADTTEQVLLDWIAEFGQVDLAIISSTQSESRPSLDWDIIQPVLDVNVHGTTAAMNVFLRHFEENQSGHLTVFTSMAAIRGQDERPAYGASKAYLETYIDGIRLRFKKAGIPIYTTMVQPGSVDTDQLAGMENLFWVVPVKKAATQIISAIKKKRSHVYISRRWRLIAWYMKWIPFSLLARTPQATNTNDTT